MPEHPKKSKYCYPHQVCPILDICFVFIMYYQFYSSPNVSPQHTGFIHFSDILKTPHFSSAWLLWNAVKVHSEKLNEQKCFPQSAHSKCFVMEAVPFQTVLVNLLWILLTSAVAGLFLAQHEKEKWLKEIGF